MMDKEKVVVISDWDADGVVSAAEIVYSQEFLGVYPIKDRCKCRLIPSTSRDVLKSLKEVDELDVEVVVVLDLALTKNLVEFFKYVKNRKNAKVIYIDHHLSTAVKASKVEKLVDEFIVGKAPTVLLVAHVLKSLGVKLSQRLEAFVKAASVLEKGSVDRDVLEKYRKLISIVMDMSRALTRTRRRDLWERLVRWLASPLSLVAMPFTPDLISTIRSADQGAEVDVKGLALELAPSATRIFNLRFVDARKVKGVRASALASCMYRIFRCPVAVLIEGSGGRRILAIRSRDDLAYRIAMKLYFMGIAKDVGGHQSLALVVLKPDVDLGNLVSAIRNAMLSS